MARTWFKRWLRRPEKLRSLRSLRRFPLLLEPLEERILLDNDFVVGRTLSSYTTADIQNGQLTLTYSVYNQQAEPINGVLLTTTLQSGVGFVDASMLPDRNGQELAWSMGKLNGFERASVQVMVSL